MKVRYIKETNPSLTKGLKYKVISESERYYLIKDNYGDEEKKRKKSFEVLPSKKLKVGDVLLAKDINDWCEIGENYYHNEWGRTWFWITGDRKIEAIEMKDGHKAFYVSGNADMWIRAKGYRKFCKR